MSEKLTGPLDDLEELLKLTKEALEDYLTDYVSVDSEEEKSIKTVIKQLEVGLGLVKSQNRAGKQELMAEITTNNTNNNPVKEAIGRIMDRLQKRKSRLF
jgi:hypothetical protein